MKELKIQGFLPYNPQLSTSLLTRPFPRIHLVRCLYQNCFKMLKEMTLTIWMTGLLTGCPNEQKYFYGRHLGLNALQLSTLQTDGSKTFSLNYPSVTKTKSFQF